MIAATLGALAWTGIVLVESQVPAEAAGTITGVDVSRWDHPNGASINWPKVKSSGRSFAVVKATQSTTYTSSYFASDYAQAKAAGLIVGAYHFAHPRLPISSAAADARHYVRTVGSFKGVGLLPPILDLECDGSGSSCYNGSRLSVGQLRQWTQTWLDTAQAMTGRVPIIYTYDSFWRNAMGNSGDFTKYPLWYARYTSTTPTAATIPGGWPRWTFWQYTSTGTTPGIPDTGDVNVFNGDLGSLRALANGSNALGTPGPVTSAKAALNGAGWTKAIWQPTATNGGARVLDYTVSVDGGEPQVTPSRAFVATGLTPGDHVLTIRARNIAGDGQAFDLPVTVSGTGAPPPEGTTRLTLSLPSTASASASFLASARLVRVDTGQAVGGADLSWRRVPKKGPELPRIPLVTSGDGTVSTSMKLPATTWTKVYFGGSSGVSASAASKSVRVRPWLAASLSDTYVPRRATVKLSARTTYLFAGETVYRQHWVSGRWKTISSKKLGVDGQTTFSVYASSKGVKSIRIYLRGTSAHLSKASSTVVLRVR